MEEFSDVPLESTLQTQLHGKFISHCKQNNKRQTRRQDPNKGGKTQLNSFPIVNDKSLTAHTYSNAYQDMLARLKFQP